MAKASVAAAIQAHMPRLTLARIGEQAMANARANDPWGRSIGDLGALGNGDKAIVVAAGPSLHRTDTAAAIADFEGAIIATDSALRYCLRNQIIPDLVVTLDPHPKRIVRWFGDPDLVAADLADDYFSRQDMDPISNELRVNEDVLRLMDLYGKGIKLAVATTSHPSVVSRAKQIGMELYWWNPMLDDPEFNGLSQALMDLNGLPCVNAGGNVGSACWMFADAVLGKKKVALTGMDFGYYDGTPYSATQYYSEAKELFGEEQLVQVYQRIFNPFVGKWFFTDPAYLWYRDCFLQMVQEANCETFNCTGGGILFGDKIKFCRSIEEFLGD